MSTALDNLTAAVAAQTTVEASVVTLLQTLSADLQTAIAANDTVAIQTAADQITSNTSALAAAVAANTPAAATGTGSTAVPAPTIAPTGVGTANTDVVPGPKASTT